MQLLFAPFFIVLALGQPALGPGDYTRSVKVDKIERSYIVHVPPTYDPKKPMPVVLVYHGASMNAKAMVYFTDLNKTSDKGNFIAVYPNGTGIGNFLTWNCGGQSLNNADDVAFTRKILDDLESVLAVDKKRVYACGISNGGMMCYRLAAELSERIAAIGSVAGTISIKETQPKRAVPVIHFHGTKDILVPLDGPNKELPLVIRFQSLDDTIRTWVKCNQCQEKPEVAKLPNVAIDMLPVTRKTYNHGKDGAEVVLYVIEGGGHTWPGMNRHAAFLGESTLNISANDVMWEFFKKHSLK